MNQEDDQLIDLILGPVSENTDFVARHRQRLELETMLAKPAKPSNREDETPNVLPRPKY